MRSLRPLSVLLAAVGSVMLIATLAYPFGYDQAVFRVGAEMLLHGKIPYRDFLDTKPPLIFYLYALAQAVFGDHPWSIRLLDVVYQFGTAWYFYRILRRECSPELSLISVALYLMLYAGSGFWMTCEAESFAMLPSLVLIDVTFRAANAGPLQSRKRGLLLGLIGGVAIFILLLLKFSLILGGVAAIVFIALRRIRSGIKWSFGIGMIVSFLIACALFLLILWQTSTLHTFDLWIGWLWHYGSLGDPEHSFIWQFCLQFPERMLYSISIALAVFAIVGILTARKQQILAFRKSLLSLLLLTGIFQLVGVLLERKIAFPYQYARALWAFAPCMALGIVAFCRIPMKRIARVVLALIAIVLSPLVRVATQTVPWTAIAISGDDAAGEVQRRIPDYFPEDEQQIGKYLAPKITLSDQIFFWGNDVEIYSQLRKLPQTSCLTATPLRTAFTPPEWKSGLMAQLEPNPPRYIIVEFGDAKPYITGSSLDSYQSLIAWPEMESFLSSRYRQDTVIGHFLIFKGTH